MKLVRRFSFVKAMLLSTAALVLSTGMAHAQSLAGKFTLPTEVHWKSVVLPAGEYRFTVQGNGVSSMVVVSSLDARHAAMLMPASISQTALSNHDNLEVAHRNGEAYVTSFEMGSLGLVFNFAAPQPKAEMASAASNTMTAGK